MVDAFKKKLLRNRQRVLILLLVAFLFGMVLAEIESTIHRTSGTALHEILESTRNPAIEELLAEMTPEEKIGQMFMACCYSGTPSTKTVNCYHLGSVLLFGNSFQKNNPETLQKKLQNLSREAEIPPLIAVDEEGGSVVRVSSNKSYRRTPFKAPRKLYANGGLSAILEETHEKNKLLRGIGIHLNLAPVCDISTNPKDFMYARSLGENAEITSEFVSETVKACREDGIGCSLKHFPGYGNVVDTHTGTAVDRRSLQELQTKDLLPFAAGIEAGAPSVLISHNIVTAIDKKNPASLSAAMHRLLREDLKFQGVIITDDLSMGALSNDSKGLDDAVAAILAGSDLLCSGDYKAQYKAVCKAYEAGLISEQRLDQSVRRILCWKAELGLIDTTETTKEER